ncbi:hypothetical protein BH23BAC1_BH23BAC1_17430 [soil metagenome]
MLFKLKYTFGKLKYIIFILPCIILFNATCLAQKPEITNINKKFAEMGVTLTITGNHFGTAINKVKVSFGAVQGEVISVSNNMIEVKIPSGTTFDNISVTNLDNGLTGFSQNAFLLSFGGFGIDSWSSQVNYTDESGLHDLCQCDFDGDGKIDVATASKSVGLISIWKNTSTLTNISFSRSTINLLNPTLYITCGDLDGDGKPDLVVSKEGTTNADRIFVLRNISTPGNIAFAPSQPFITKGFGSRVVVIKDLDNDGKPEITVANKSSKFFIFQNTSTSGTISFVSDCIELDVAAASSNGLAIGDLNQDGLADIVVVPEIDKDVFIYQNTSKPGQISFNAAQRIAVSGSLAMVRLGDLDQDGKPEIIVTKFISSPTTDNLAILLNRSSPGGAISFAAPQSFTTNPRPWGIDLGDLDGDGIVDIAVATIEPTNYKITLLKNNSSPGSLSFTRSDISTTVNSRSIKIGDYNGDGKPDLGFTSEFTYNISFLRNRNCFSPKIEPPDNLILCQGSILNLQASRSLGTTYTWFRNNVALTETTSSLAVTLPGEYKVQAVSESGSCSKTSEAITISSSNGDSPDPPSATNSGPVCQGGKLQLKANTISNAQYKWTGPNNYTSNLQNPEINNVRPEMAGIYYLEVKVGECLSDKVSTLVEINTVETQTIQANGATTLCEGKEVKLSVPLIAGYGYQWKLNGTAITGAILPNLQASKNGTYSIIITKNNCQVESQPFRVNILPPPSASFTAPEFVCNNNNFELKNTTQTAPDVNVFNLWDFGDGNTSTSKDAVHKYTSNGNYSVKLIVHYEDEDCKSEFTRNIIVEDNISITILSDIQGTPCEGEEVTLYVAGTYANYSWSTGETTPTIKVKQSGLYTLNVSTSEGCTGSDEIELDFLSAPILDLYAEDNITQISKGESIQLNASGAYSYSWFPVEGLSDPNSPNPVAQPLATTTYKLTGTAANGCSTIKEITIDVGNSINVNPHKLFSPNGDMVDDYWQIDRIQNYPDCTVSIFDRQGSKVYEAKGYNNEWNGTFNGKNLMQGVYFYVIRCGSKENQKSGSITLIR